METFLYMAVEALVVAGAIWGSIRLVDPGNPENSFGLAFVFAASYLLIALFLSWIQFLPVVVFIWLLVRHYDLALWKCLFVLVVSTTAALAFELLVIP